MMSESPTRGQPYYVMKHVDGRDFGDVLLEAQGDAAEARSGLLRLFLAICEGVAFAHQRGVLHLDLKPANIRLGEHGEALVLDWGLATAAQLVAPLGPNGSPGFVSPERLRGDPPSPAADQWSLGAILFEILAGQPPFPGPTPEQRLRQTLAGPPADVCLVDPEREIPDEIGEIAMRALQPAPTARFASVGDLAAAVRSFVEGRERRRRALALVAEADALAPEEERVRAAVADCLHRAGVAMGALRPTSPLADKEPAWLLEEQAEALSVQADLLHTRWEQHLRSALSLVPELHEAHRRLAAAHRRALEDAEARRARGPAAQQEWLLRHHDRGHHRRYLNGEATLHLRTEPAAQVTLCRLERSARRLRATETRDLGQSPILDLRLPPGSYVLTLAAPGRHTVVYPICLERTGRWDALPPGAQSPDPVILPALGDVNDDEVYIPGGWALFGGDPDAPEALSRRRVWVDAFALSRHPVTNADYARFLDALHGAGHTAAVARYSPRDRPRPAHPLDGEPHMALGPDGRVGPAAAWFTEDWARLPVVAIDLVSARAFAAFRGRRLPDELEIEKAARGVDGRFYPWGDAHDPALSNIVSSLPRPRVMPVDDFADDRSVYDVWGLAGNVRTLCGNAWTAEGPAQDGERLVHRPAPEDVEFIAVRGGAFGSSPALSRAAVRFGDAPTTRYTHRGLRLARSL